MSSPPTCPPNKPLRELVYSSLKRQILSGQILSGVRLGEASLTSALKASRRKKKRS